MPCSIAHTEFHSYIHRFDSPPIHRQQRHKPFSPIRLSKQSLCRRWRFSVIFHTCENLWNCSIFKNHSLSLSLNSPGVSGFPRQQKDGNLFCFFVFFLLLLFRFLFALAARKSGSFRASRARRSRRGRGRQTTLSFAGKTQAHSTRCTGTSVFYHVPT